jgi:nucleoside 2-deoxyribosyltransferase
MKIYFAGPLFTPYVRNFISEHAQILRDNGIEPFVPHEKFNSFITPVKVQELVDEGLVPADILANGNFREQVMTLVRQGKISRERLGLPQMSPETIFSTDYEGLSTADAVVAILDGTQVDDGTACEIGIFYGLMRRDPSKKGVVGFMTDSRGISRAEKGYGTNLFVWGVVEECGTIYDNFGDVIAQLKAWEA